MRPSCPAAAHSATPGHLTFDESPDGSPDGVINFRTTSSVPAGAGNLAHPHLHDLYLSGSSQFDRRGLLALRAALAEPLRRGGRRHVQFLDARQERHGLVGDHAVGLRSPGNQGSGDGSRAALLAHEDAWLTQLGQTPAGSPLPAWRRNHDRLEPATLAAAPTLSEAALLATQWQPAAPAPDAAVTAAMADWPTRCGYTRLPMLDGAEVPPDATVDALVHLVREELPAAAWVHVHCLHGHGRTSLIMLCYDIVVSAPKVKLKRIVARQRSLPQAQAPDTQATQRFLRRFHRYCRDTDGVIDAEPWSRWHARDGGGWARLRRTLCLG